MSFFDWKARDRALKEQGWHVFDGLWTCPACWSLTPFPESHQRWHKTQSGEK